MNADRPKCYPGHRAYHGHPATDGTAENLKEAFAADTDAIGTVRYLLRAMLFLSLLNRSRREALMSKAIVQVSKTTHEDEYAENWSVVLDSLINAVTYP